MHSHPSIHRTVSCRAQLLTVYSKFRVLALVKSFARIASIWFIWSTSFLVGTADLNANEFQVRVVDAETKKPISVRMSIRNARGALIKQRGVPFHAGQFCFFGSHNFKLPRGVYSYTIEKGLEYRTVSGQFEIKRGANDGVTVSVPRFANLGQRGWWSGDLMVQRRADDLPILVDANDLAFANLIAESNAGLAIKPDFPKQAIKKVNDRISIHQTGILDARAGGGLIWIRSPRLKLPEPGSILPLRLHPDSLEKADKEKNGSSPIAILDHASAWDLPLLLADHRSNGDRGLNGICIAGSTLNSHDKSGKPKKISRKELRPFPADLPGDHPFEEWQSKVYFHVLNCGFRIPPAALSNSGDSPNPTGYNRVYVHTGQEFSADKWLENFCAGRVVVTNGPVMNPLFNGVLPGETFQVGEGKSIDIEPTLTLSLKEKAEYLEIIRNGLVAKKISLDEYAKARGRLPKVTFTESGWMLVRVVISNKNSYRFAMSGPIYIEVGRKPVLKKESAKFFLDWVIERGKQLKASSSEESEHAFEQIRPAYQFWKQLADQ